MNNQNSKIDKKEVIIPSFKHNTMPRNLTSGYEFKEKGLNKKIFWKKLIRRLLLL